MQNTLLSDCSTHYNNIGNGSLWRGSQYEADQFSVYNSDDILDGAVLQPLTAYPCRVNYKICLLRGRSRAEYADKVVDIEPDALLFSTPKIPYHWTPLDMNLSGIFCVFTADFLLPTKSGVLLDELPIFKAGGYPIFQLTAEESNQVQTLFQKMQTELASDYIFKYDLLRTYVLELIHIGQKLQPAHAWHPIHGASVRVSSLFTELLERQFPISGPDRQLSLRTAKDYADQLAVHVNYLNKALKEATGRTTSELINHRIVQEAKRLLWQPNWTLTEIADSLGFTDVAHFSKSFKQQTALTPGAYRHQQLV